MIRIMQKEDYAGVYALWSKIPKFALRQLDDSQEGIYRFLDRNPSTSVVAVEDGRIVGSVLCGHDGRRGCLYHVCVDPSYQRRHIGKSMVEFAVDALKKEDIHKVTLIAFLTNEKGNAFWKRLGYSLRDDVCYYDFDLHSENKTFVNP